ncbi:indole-3-glycerol phosphate synthase [Methanobrevibacter cuticularis]|uniref:Indole-3-glycerol phosphate synthase n=1 Tax=Methanobrevibacter cuticularis TaxID=47311 RepID=A0A166CSB9_9EURY|nr:indole-3-glycerol phosphate synthase TrpC [Methanobrevibacter cuticularis]KZX14811.1 indole-3-glycerol phosphate synthase [Methanobrevibacter cuticularis]
MILDKIVKTTKDRIEEKKKKLPIEKLIAEIEAKNRNMDEISDKPFPFENALKSDDISLICEIKRASPSKGIISDDFNYLEIAKEYEKGGASAISILTEPYFFKGHDKYISEISSHVTIPILRKDFVIDHYMIYEAKLLGASAILLICSILSKDQLNEYIKISHNLGLSALVEAHTHEEIKIAISAGARIIGVNNRNLKNFEVNIDTSINLRKHVPKNILFVSESGIKTQEDIKILRDNKVNGALIGESLMKSKDKVEAISKLKNI